MISFDSSSRNKDVGDRSRQLGWRYRLYVFSAVYRNVCFNNLTLSTFTIVLDFFLSAIPAVYPMLTFFQSRDNDDQILNNIFYSSIVLSGLTPNLIPTDTLLITGFVFFIIIVAFFIICLYYSHLIRKLHYFLMFSAHTFFFHVFSGVVGYAIYYIFLGWEISKSRAIICGFYLFFYIFYLIFMMCILYIEFDSLIRPNVLLAEWFHGYAFIYPIVILFESNVGYHTQRIPNLYVRIILYSSRLIFHVAHSFITIRKQPFMLFIINDIFASKSIILSIYCIWAIMANFYADRFGAVTVSSIAILGLSVFTIVHFGSEYRRKQHEHVLNQLDNVENLTVESIRVALSSLNSENTLQLVIKSGMTTGNKAIISYPFVRYCIECYPTSNWMLSFIVFLYGTFWGSDPSTYKFFLHLLSLETYHVVPELHLFQNIYCYMQSSENISPLVARYLEQYRWSMLMLVQGHKDFWNQVSTTTSLKHFSKILIDISSNFCQHRDKLQNLKDMFPYSPSMLLEYSIFKADFQHEFLKSSKYYDKGTYGAKHGIKNVSKNLFLGFQSFFPYGDNSLEKNEEKSTFDFISLKEHHDRAQRHSNVLVTNDSYVKTISNLFTIKQENMPQHVTFFRAEMFFIVSTIILMILSYIIIFLSHLLIVELLPKEKFRYQEIVKMMDNTVHFRQDIAITEYNMMLLLTIQNRTFENISRKYLREGGETPPSILVDEFFWFALKHLDIIEEITISYKYYAETLNRTLNLDKIYAFGIEQKNMNFVTTYMDFHRLSIMFIQSRSIYDSEINQSEFYFYVSALSDLASQIYVLLGKKIYDYKYSSFDRNKKWLITLPVIDIASAILLCAILEIFYKSLIMKFFSILRTVQPPALKTISNIFNRLLLYKEHHIPHVKANPAMHPILYFGISLVIISMAPVYFCIKVAFFKDEPFKLGQLPQLPPIDDSLIFMYYTFASIEYLQSIKSDIMRHFDEAIVNDTYGKNALCVHGMFDKISDMPRYTDSYFENLNVTHCYLTTGITLIFSLFFFILFLWSVFKYTKAVSSSRLMFYFIPLHAAQTNPVLSTLYNGQSISKKKVKLFSSDLMKVPSKFDFFCSIFFNQNDEIISIVGQPKKLLGIEPSSFVNLQIFLVTSAKVHENVSINDFFKDRPSKPLYFTLEDGVELSMHFNNERELFIKDESANQAANRRRRIVQELTKVNTFQKELTTLNTSSVILIIIDVNNQNETYNIYEKKLKFPDIIQFDSRNHRYSFFICAQSMPNKLPTEAANICMKFFKEIIPFLDSSKCVIGFGGPIHLIDCSKCVMAKSRVVGLIYDVLTTFVSAINAGQIYVTKEMAELLCDDLDIFEFKEFSVTDVIDIQASILPYEIVNSC